MTVLATTIKLELEFSADSWTDIWSDVRTSKKVTIKQGISGFLPTNRVASPGQLTFALDNSDTNSGGAQGYYSPDHGSNRSGFELGIKGRLVVTYSGSSFTPFFGTLTDIQVVPGQKGAQYTNCVLSDFMYDMQQHKLDLLEVQTNQRADQLITTIVGNMATSPEATSYATGQETFAYSGDDFKDEKTTALAAAQKLCMSELGYLFVDGDTLTFQDRHTRVKDLTSLSTVSNTMHNLPVTRDIENCYNYIKAVAYPREVGTSVEVIYNLNSTPEIPAGSKYTVIARYSDPSNRDTRVSAKDLWDPEGLNKITDAGDERSFEGGVTGWTAVGTGAQSTDQAKVGSNSYKLTSGVGATNQYYVYSSKYNTFVQGDVVYVSCWVYAAAAWPDGVELYMLERNSADATVAEGLVEETATTGSWVRLSGIYTCTHADCDGLRVTIGQRSSNQDFSGGAVIAYFDDIYLIHDSELNFEFSDTPDGGGVLNDDLVFLGTEQGGNSCKFVLENVGTSFGYLTGLSAEGILIRQYEAAPSIAEDSTSQTTYGKHELSLILPYQDDPFAAQDWADVTLAQWKDPQTIVSAVSFLANQNDAHMVAALARGISNRITLTETVTGLSSQDYFIQEVQYVISEKEHIECTWGITKAYSDAYWLIGEAGSGEIGDTTWVGY